MSAVRAGAQFVVIAALFAAVAMLSDRPLYRQLPPGHGVVTLTFVHGAGRRGDCRRLTSEEIARLPPNMRRVQDCPRERRPVYVELDVDGRAMYRASLPPTGIAGDGPSRVYQKFVLPEGAHDIAVRMRDTAGEGFDHQDSRRVALAADQNFVIDFHSETGRFIFR